MKTDVNHSVFVSYDKLTLIFVYMDNLFIIGENLNIINNLKNKLLERFRMTNLELVSHYLGMFVTQTRNSMSLDQKSYLEKVILRFGIDTCKPGFLPMDFGVPNSILLAPEN